MPFAEIFYILLFLPLVALVCVAVSTKYVLGWLRAQQIVDTPNSRSNHTLPTPRGGGIAVVGVILLCWAAAPFVLGFTEKPMMFPSFWPFLAATLGLAVVSFADDRTPLNPAIRLLAQIVAVWVGMYALEAPVFLSFLPEGTPLWVDAGLTMLCWLWFINLFNFMDGIDGITGMQSLHICLGVWVLALIGQLPDMYLIYTAIIGAAAVGFLVWNWHPAKLFLGDVGSVPLGFMLGFLLLQTAALGHPVAALILPAYYLADAGITLLKRIGRREKIWQAHSSHYYQQAVRSGWSHSTVVLCIAMANLLLLIDNAALLIGVVEEIEALAIAVAIALCTLGILRYGFFIVPERKTF